MKQMTTILMTLFVFIWSFSVQADDQKSIQKKIVVKSIDEKAGLGIMAVASSDADGIRVSKVFPGSEAERIGIQSGDILTELNGKKLASPSDIIKMMEDAKAGDQVDVVVLRDGTKKTMKAVLKPFKTGDQPLQIIEEDGDKTEVNVLRMAAPNRKMKFIKEGEFETALTQKGGYLGVAVKALSDQLRTYFEVKNGVLIESVEKDSPAEKAGLSAGDVITALNDRKIEDPEDLVRSVNYFNPDEKVKVYFVRKGDKKSMDIVLGKKPAMKWHGKNSPVPFGMIGTDDGKQIIIESQMSDEDAPATKDMFLEVNKEVVIF